MFRSHWDLHKWSVCILSSTARERSVGNGRDKSSVHGEGVPDPCLLMADVAQTSYHKLGFPMEIFPGYAHFPLSVSASRINHDKPHTLGFKGLCKDHAYEFFFHFNNWSPSRNNVVHDALSVNHGLATSKSSQETATAMRTLSNAARNFGDLNSDLRRAVSVNAGDTSALETTLRNITNRIRSLKPVRPDWHPRVPRRKSPEGEAIAARKAEVLKAMSHLASYHDELPFDDGSDDEEDEP